MSETAGQVFESYDIQKLPEDSIERQALHNLLTAVEALIQAVDAD